MTCIPVSQSVQATIPQIANTVVVSNNKTILIITSNVVSRGYTNFDWLRKNIESIKYHVTFNFYI